VNICTRKRSCARVRVHAAEKHGDRIFIRICNCFVLRWRGACTFPQPRRRSNQRRSFCMSKVMDDTAFFAQEAAQGAATSRLGVPALGEGRGRSPAKGKVETTKTSGARAVEITECADSLITTYWPRPYFMAHHRNIRRPSLYHRRKKTRDALSASRLLSIRVRE
jgi:hypothetical protein